MEKNQILLTIIRKRLDDDIHSLSRLLDVNHNLLRCFESGLIEYKSFDERFLRSINRYIKNALKAKPLTKNEKVVFWKRKNKLKDKDACKMLDISIQSLNRYKMAPSLLSEELHKKIEEFFHI